MKRAIPLLLCAVLLLAACSSAAVTPSPTAAATDSPTAAPTASPAPAEETATASPTVEPTVAPTPTPAASLTSGLPMTREYKPLCIMVENQTQARPQAGLGSADIVYEVLENGYSMTRFVAVFNDNYPTRVGPVRSCRSYYVYIAEEFKSLLAFYGGPEDKVGKGAINPIVNTALKNGLLKVGANGLMAKYDNYFPRDKNLAETGCHNVIVDANVLATLLTEKVEPAEHFQYDANAVFGGDDVSNIEIVYNKSIIDVKYQYDPAAKNYKRWQGKDPMIDADTNSQITVTNVIIQYAITKGMGNENGLALAEFEMTGKGNADIFAGGKHIKATWKRPSLGEITRYYDESGNEIKLLPGNTWVQVVPSNKHKVPINFS